MRHVHLQFKNHRFSRLHFSKRAFFKFIREKWHINCLKNSHVANVQLSTYKATLWKQSFYFLSTSVLSAFPKPSLPPKRLTVDKPNSPDNATVSFVRCVHILCSDKSRSFILYHRWYYQPFCILYFSVGRPNTPVNNQLNTPPSTSVSSPVNGPLNAQPNNPFDSLINGPSNPLLSTQVDSLSNSPLNTAPGSPVNSSPYYTAPSSPVSSLSNSPFNTQANSPLNALPNTPVSSQSNSPLNSPPHSPVNIPWSNIPLYQPLSI